MLIKRFPLIHQIVIFFVSVILLLLFFLPSKSSSNQIIISVKPEIDLNVVIEQPKIYSTTNIAVDLSKQSVLVSDDVIDIAAVKTTPSLQTKKISAQPSVDTPSSISVFDPGFSTTILNELLPTMETVPEATAPPKPRVSIRSIEVKQGDTLSHVFERGEASINLLMNLLAKKDIKKQFNTVYPGEKIEFHVLDQEIIAIELIKDRRTKYVVNGISNKKFTIEKQEKPINIVTKFAQAQIELSLFGSAEKAGINSNLTAQLLNIFGWDIDFGQDIRRGDHFNFMYQQEYVDNQPFDSGKIIAAQFHNNNRLYQATLYQDASGVSDYFDENGRSMKKSFLRTPVDASRISSGFNPRRLHPVLGTVRPHRGTDYAAPTGTPIKASGSGKIIFRGKKSGYGKVVILQHQQNITTLYAHMHNFKRGQSVGKKVAQGDIIGYVGMSGTATGPHLHYEFRVNGIHKNPVTVKLPKAIPINKKYKSDYLAKASKLFNQLTQYANTATNTVKP